MGRPDLATRVRRAVESAVDVLDDRSTAVVVFTGGFAVAGGLHLLLGDTRLAWLAVPLVLLAGLSMETRGAVAVAVVALALHTTVDLILGVNAGDAPGILVRGAVLLLLAVIGSAGHDLARQRDRALERAYNEDPVTGLLNVRVFYDELADLRRREVPFTLLLADIRGMRAMNERFGHPAGTEAMRTLAQVLRRVGGPDDLASRLGSDELAIAFVGRNLDDARAAVREVIERLDREMLALPGGGRVELHAAYGLARFPEDGDDEVEVLRAAEHAKQRAKAAGLDQVGTASEVDGERHDGRPDSAP